MESSSRDRRLPTLVAVVFLALVALASWWPLRPPAVVGAEAGESEFSAERAFEHLERIAAAPRPSGSAHHAEVREYLLRQIESFGLEAQVQAETVVAEFGGRTRIARIRNVLARLPGTSGGATLLAVAHYDSAPHSPGASDAGSGVVALLETMRALRAGPALANDVIFLFSDGEERGLLGAHGFTRHHPWAAEVDLVFNFEARGARGPSIMFETGPGTGALMGDFASFAPRPVASSFSDGLYQRLPNDTDFTVFKRAGKPGFNFAYIRDVAAYHTALDSLERIDLRSLQHHGDYALSLLRGFGDQDLTGAGAGRPTLYFNVPLLGLVVYPSGWTLPLLAIALLVAGWAIVRALRVGRATAGRVAAAFGLVVGALLGAGAAVFGLDWVLRAVLVHGRGFLSGPSTYRLGLMLAALAVAAGILQWAAKKLGIVATTAGALLLWAVLAIVSVAAMPSASYLLILPLLFAAVALLVLCRGSEGARSAGGEAALLALAIPALILWAPLPLQLGDALADQAGLVLGVIVGLAATAVVPQLALCVLERRWLIPAATFAAGLVLCLVQAAGAGFDAARPRPTSLFYALDPAEPSALWASWSRPGDPWARGFLGDDPERRSLEAFFGRPFEAWVAAAPVAALVGPRAVDLAAVAGPGDGSGGEAAEDAEPEAVEPVAESASAALGGRTLRLRVDSPRRAATVAIDLRSGSLITRVTVDGRPVDVAGQPRPDDAPAGFLRMVLYGAGDHAFEIEVELSGSQPLEALLVDSTYALPPGLPAEPRPAATRPSSWETTDSTLVRSAFVF